MSDIFLVFTIVRIISLVLIFTIVGIISLRTVRFVFFSCLCHLVNFSSLESRGQRQASGFTSIRTSHFFEQFFLVFNTGTKNPPGWWVWVWQVWVRASNLKPIRNPHPKQQVWPKKNVRRSQNVTNKWTNLLNPDPHNHTVDYYS